MDFRTRSLNIDHPDQFDEDYDKHIPNFNNNNHNHFDNPFLNHPRIERYEQIHNHHPLPPPQKPVTTVTNTASYSHDYYQQQQQQKSSDLKFEWLNTVSSILPSIELSVALKALQDYSNLDDLVQYLINYTTTKEEEDKLMDKIIKTTTPNNNNNTVNNNVNNNNNNNYFIDENDKVIEQIAGEDEDDVYEDVDEDFPITSPPAPLPLPTTTTTTTSTTTTTTTTTASPTNFLDDEQREIIKLLEEETKQERERLLRKEQQEKESMAFILSTFKDEIQMDVDLDNSRNDDYIERLLEQDQNEIEKKRREEELRNEQMLNQLILEEKHQKDIELENKTYTCDICLSDDLYIQDIYTLDDCHHRFCKECLGTHFKTKIENGDCNSVQCPNTLCRRIVNYQEIKHNVSIKTLIKYEDFLLQLALAADQNCRYCPRPGCKNAMIGDPDTVTMIICSNEQCKFAFCFNCKLEWHEGISCAQYKQWKDENDNSNQKFEQWAKENTKPCPNCKSKIEKNGGCNHMTCKSCKHQFCWLCLENYSSVHFTKSNGKCKQYS